MSSVQYIKWQLFHVWLSLRMREKRKKGKIRFLFILQELSQWKTELLYQTMLDHPRFEPILGITPCIEYPGAEQKLIEYCKRKRYNYVWLDPQKTIVEQIQVDMMAYQKPYSDSIYPLHQINSNKSIPTVYVPYYLSTIAESWLVNPRPCLLAWRCFVDNESCLKEWKELSKMHGRNLVVTGLPIMDELLIPKSQADDVWPCLDHRKRIIYAPHHTIGGYHMDGIEYSTFMDYCDFMLELAEKYQDQAYFVFKPHPRLFRNLLKVWGEEKTKCYYDLWNKPGVSHVETHSNYMDLFKYSDAMIHDCGSFTMEYLYTGNPVMYLTKSEHHVDNLNNVAKRAFNLHYQGKTKEDIETFVVNVLNGIDALASERDTFVKESLLPPNGKTACENIIDVILGG